MNQREKILRENLTRWAHQFDIPTEQQKKLETEITDHRKTHSVRSRGDGNMHNIAYNFDYSLEDKMSAEKVKEQATTLKNILKNLSHDTKYELETQMPPDHHDRHNQYFVSNIIEDLISACEGVISTTKKKGRRKNEARDLLIGRVIHQYKIITGKKAASTQNGCLANLILFALEYCGIPLEDESISRKIQSYNRQLKDLGD